MIKRYVAQSSTIAALREELYTWLTENSDVVKGLTWRNDNDHSEGFDAYYDSAKTDFCAHIMCNANQPADVTYQHGQYLSFIKFPFSEAIGVNSSFNVSKAETATFYKAFFVETDTAFMMIYYNTDNVTISSRGGQYFIITKNKGCAVNYSYGGTWYRKFAFKGDFDYINMNQPTSDTNLTCFAPLCGRSQQIPNNQIYFTPFTSTPDYPCIIDSDIGKYATDGYFAVAETIEEVDVNDI